MITTILSFLAKGTLLLLKSIVILCGVGAVVFVMLFILKFIVGALAKMLGVNGSSGGGGGAVGGLLNTVNRGINGVFSGIGTVFSGVTKGTGTVFNGVANTAGMTRDKMLGVNNHNYNKRNNNYNNYNNDYDYDYMNDKRNRRGRMGRNKTNFYDTHDQPYYNNNNLYSESPISNKVGDPNDPTDQYFTAKRYYDDDGFDQFGFNKDGKHKDEVMKELLDKNKKEKSNKISDLYQDKEFSDSEVANQWIKDARFKKPSTWVYGAAGLTYAAAHGIGKALNKDVPDDWEDLENKDSGIQKTVDMTQEDINMAEERKDNAPDGGITSEELVNNSEFVEEAVDTNNNLYSGDSILEEIENHKMKEKVPVYAGVEEDNDKELASKEYSSPLSWDSNEDPIIDLNNELGNDESTIEQVDLNANFSNEDLGILGDLEENIHNENNKPEEEDWFAESDSKIKEL